MIGNKQAAQSASTTATNSQQHQATLTANNSAISKAYSSLDVTLDDELKRLIQEGEHLDQLQSDLSHKSDKVAPFDECPEDEASAGQASSTADPDDRSVFVRNVHFKATADQLKEHFKDCGEIKRITIPVDHATKQAKGHAFIEFDNMEGVMRAKCLSETLFHGRQITVVPKRKNIPQHQMPGSNYRGRATHVRGGGQLNQAALVQMASMLSMAMIGSQQASFGTGNFHNRRGGRASAPFHHRGGRR